MDLSQKLASDLSSLLQEHGELSERTNEDGPLLQYSHKELKLLLRPDRSFYGVIFEALDSTFAFLEDLRFLLIDEEAHDLSVVYSVEGGPARRVLEGFIGWRVTALKQLAL